MTLRPRLVLLLLLAVLALLSACTGSHLEPPDVQGPMAMVEDGGKPRLWILSRQEEVRQVRIGGGGSRTSGSWRGDTFFHFRVEAFDPATARPLWKKTLLTLGDFEAGNKPTSRVLGSSVDAQLLGQDGDLVWLRIGEKPYAVDAHDGHVVIDGDSLQQRNPQLQGLLPSEGKNYDFDQGLVLLAADAQRFVVRGPEAKAEVYVPPVVTEEQGPLLANGARRTVPMRPPFDVPLRQVRFAGEWLGLYSEKEAVDAARDEFGDNLLYPYTVLDESSLSRRSLWRAKIDTVQRFDDRYERLVELLPVAGSPVFLRGRFLAAGGEDTPLVLTQPDSLVVMHNTRIDNAGRRALTRLGADLKPLWTTELPLSDYGSIAPPRYWRLGDHLVVVGEMRAEVDSVTRDTSHLVSVRLADGALQAWNLASEAPVEPIGTVAVEAE